MKKNVAICLLSLMVLCGVPSFVSAQTYIPVKEMTSQTTACNPAESTNYYWYLSDFGYGTHPFDNFGVEGGDVLIGGGSNGSSIDIRRNGVLRKGNCDTWERVSNVAKDGEDVLAFINRDNCVFDIPNYTKTSNPGAIDAQIHFTIGYRAMGSSYSQPMNSFLYYVPKGSDQYKCYPNGNFVSDASNCPTVSVNYSPVLRSHTGECQNYILFRCGDGLVNKPIGAPSTYDNLYVYEECDPAAPAWKDRSDGKSCNASCKIEYEASACGSLDGTTAYNSNYSSPRITESTPGLCGVGKVVAGTLSYDKNTGKYTWDCKNGEAAPASCNAQDLWCGDGTVQTAYEQCDKNDKSQKGWEEGTWKTCNSSCKLEDIPRTGPVCSSTYNNATKHTDTSSTAWLSSSDNLCDKGSIVPGSFSGSGAPRTFTWSCTNDGLNTNCKAYQQRCGDGVKNGNEVCDPEDKTNKSGWGDGCSATCDKATYNQGVCGSKYHQKKTYMDIRYDWITEYTPGLCDKGTVIKFTKHTSSHVYTWQCSNGGNPSDTCRADQEWCGDEIVQSNEGESCDEGSKNGTSGSTCSDKCTKVSDVACGSNDKKTTYSFSKKTTPWLTKTSDGMCAAGLTVGAPYITGSDSHLEWTCSNANGGQKTCHAYQAYCGDEIVQSNEGESCDEGSKNGTSSSTCSATCTTVSNVACGSNDKGTTYFSVKQLTPWLTKTSNGMCAAGLTVGAPYITGSDSHLEWTCSNANGGQKTCNAYQTYCGDGVLQSDKEECDYKDGNETNWGNDGCDMSCKQKNEIVSACDLENTFHYTLRQGYEYTFWDNFNAKDADRRLFGDPDVTFVEQQDFNRGPNPTFKWTNRSSEKKVEKGKTERIIESTPKYYIQDHPDKRSEDNIYIEYNVKYANGSAAPESRWKTHKECVFYEISRCGDGILDTNWEGKKPEHKAEECDPKDPNQTNWGNGGCSDTCEPIASKGELVVEKTLISDTKYVTAVGQEMVWQIKVTASGGDLKNVLIKDDLPEVLSYVTYTNTLPSGVTMNANQPTRTNNGKHLEWQTSGTLTSGKSIILVVTTKVEKMPKTTDNYKNVACAVAEGVDEDCDRKPVEPTKGEPRIVKELEEDIPVERVGQVLTWKVTVTAKGGDVTDFQIQDKLPEALDYVTGKVVNNEDKLIVTGPTSPVRSGNYNIYTWNVKGTLKENHVLTLEIETKVNKMPKGNDDYLNIACVIDEGKIDCDNDEPPVKDGELDVVKTLVSENKYVTHVGQGLEWSIVVTANKGDVEMEWIKDKLPAVLDYSGYKVKEVPSGITIDEPTFSKDRKEITWKTTGTLKSGNHIELRLYTVVNKMPEQTVENVACAKPIDPGQEDCGTGHVNDLRIKKFVWDGETWAKNMTGKVGGPIKYRIEFGNSGDNNVLVTLNDYLPKGVNFISGTLFVGNENKSGEFNAGGNYDIKYEGKIVSLSGVDVNSYTGVFLKAGERGILTIEGTIKDDKDNRTNFACIFDEKNKQDSIECDDAHHNIEEEEMKCEKIDIPSGELPYGGGEKEVKCTASEEADLIVIDCGEGAKGSRYITGSNTSVRTGTCSYPSGAHTYRVSCRVEKDGKSYTSESCEGSVKVKSSQGGNPPNPPTPPTPPTEDPEIYDSAHCFDVNTNSVSIEQGETLPFYWNIAKIGNIKDIATEIKGTYYATESEVKNNIYKYEGDKCDEDNLIAVDSMLCTFKITNGERVGGNPRVVYEKVIPCLRDTGNKGIDYVSDKPLLDAWMNYGRNKYQGNGDYMFFWTFNNKDTVITLRSNLYAIEKFAMNYPNGEAVKTFGEYKISLTDIEYLQCRGGRWTSESPNIKSCENDFMVTNSYTVQKTPSGNLKASTEKLDNYLYIDGTSPLKMSGLLKAISTSEYQENAAVKTAMDNFINKYKKLAVSTKNGLMKVPGKSIYFVSDDISIGCNDSKIPELKTPTTIVQIGGDKRTRICGSVDLNIMILTQGSITFEDTNQCNPKVVNQPRQTVRGIFYAESGIIRQGVLKNNNLNANRRCTEGGLTIKGVLIGKGLQNVMDASRSNLNNWFDEDKGGKNAQTVMNGASVLIEYSPSVFTKSTMPPGAEDFTTALSIYKQ